jgi:hypothetical protein
VCYILSICCFFRLIMRCIPPVRDGPRVAGRVCEIPMLFIEIAIIASRAPGR